MDSKGATMTLTTIEKAAKLMGYEAYSWSDRVALFKDGEVIQTEFNPYTNKADLMDVENWLADNFLATFIFSKTQVYIGGIDRLNNRTYETYEMLDAHPDKFTARAHAVMAVVEQIYDRREG